MTRVQFEYILVQQLGLNYVKDIREVGSDYFTANQHACKESGVAILSSASVVSGGFVVQYAVCPQCLVLYYCKVSQQQPYSLHGYM